MTFDAKGILARIFVTSQFARAINNPATQIGLPAVAGAYFLTLDVWGTEWAFVVAHKAAHAAAFVILLFAVVCIQIFRVVSDSISRAGEESYLGFLEGFMIFAAGVVNCKLKRFQGAAKKLTPTGNTFKAITKPKDQIEYIIDGSARWLRNSFSLGEDQISVTVIHVNGRDSTIYFMFDNHSPWNRTRAKDLLNGNSAASYCLKEGEPVFFADKEQAARDGRYLLSDRDRRTGTGSAYSYPVFAEMPSHEDKYVISIVTYGKRLCSPNDVDASKIAQSILREICRRIELELTLLSMRAWQFNE